MRRRLLAPVVIVVALRAGACGADTAEPEPSAPAENIDPASDNVITGPINKARDTADDAEDRYQQLENSP